MAFLAGKSPNTQSYTVHIHTALANPKCMQCVPCLQVGLILVKELLQYKMSRDVPVCLLKMRSLPR